jgi:hypothetical protein
MSKEGTNGFALSPNQTLVRVEPAPFEGMSSDCRDDASGFDLCV